MQPDMLVRPDAEHYIAQFSGNQERLPGQGLGWLDESRQKAMTRFGKQGFPTLKEEDWKYTSLRPVTSKAFSLVDPGENQDFGFDAIPDLDSYQIVFSNGHFVRSAELNGLVGVHISSLSKCLNDSPELVEAYFGKILADGGHSLTSLNNGMHQDGVVVILDDNVQLDKPIEIVNCAGAEDSLIQPRHLFVIGKHSKAKIIERQISSESALLNNSVTEILVKEKGELDHYQVQTPSQKSYYVNGTWSKQHKDSRVSFLTFTLGGAIVRNDLRAVLNEPGAHCDMLGVYSLSGKQHVDNHTTVEHVAPQCTSNELYKGVLDQRSRGVFHGRIKVHQDAQKTDAQQSNNTLILSRDAEIDTKPQLEIYADDVKCSHGATIGQLDENSMFYLRSRGIDRNDARSMLTYAFVNEVLDEVSEDALRAYLESLLASKLVHED